MYQSTLLSVMRNHLKRYLEMCRFSQSLRTVHNSDISILQSLNILNSLKSLFTKWKLPYCSPCLYFMYTLSYCIPVELKGQFLK